MVEETKVADSVLRVVKGDLTKMSLDAFVYYARHDLVLGAGWGNAITVRGGPSIQKELNELGPVETCDVVVSEAGELPSKYIIHAVGPRFQEPELEEKLRRTMQNVFAAVAEKGVKTLGFPAMGAGFYGIPLDDCARIMIEEIERHLREGAALDEVVICLVDARERKPFLARLGGEET